MLDIENFKIGKHCMSLLLECSLATANIRPMKMWFHLMVWFALSWVEQEIELCACGTWTPVYLIDKKISDVIHLLGLEEVTYPSKVWKRLNLYFGGDFPRANPAWSSLRTIGNHLVRPPANITWSRIFV